MLDLVPGSWEEAQRPPVRVWVTGLRCDLVLCGRPISATVCLCVWVCLGVSVGISERSRVASQLLSCVYLFISVGIKHLQGAQSNYLRQGLYVTLSKQSSLLMLTFIVGESRVFNDVQFPKMLQNQKGVTSSDWRHLSGSSCLCSGHSNWILMCL